MHFSIFLLFFSRESKIKFRDELPEPAQCGGVSSTAMTLYISMMHASRSWPELISGIVNSSNLLVIGAVN